MVHSMLKVFRQDDADLHAISTARWASPYERAMACVSIMNCVFEVEHEKTPTREVKFDLNSVVLFFEVDVPYETVLSCPTVKYGSGILAQVHGFSAATIKRNKSGTTLRFVSTVAKMDATFSYKRTTSIFRWFLQTSTLGMLLFFLFLGGVRLIYGSEEDVDLDEVWEILDE